MHCFCFIHSYAHPSVFPTASLLFSVTTFTQATLSHHPPPRLTRQSRTWTASRASETTATCERGPGKGAFGRTSPPPSSLAKAKTVKMEEKENHRSLGSASAVARTEKVAHVSRSQDGVSPGGRCPSRGRAPSLPRSGPALFKEAPRRVRPRRTLSVGVCAWERDFKPTCWLPSPHGHSCVIFFYSFKLWTKQRSPWIKVWAGDEVFGAFFLRLFFCCCCCFWKVWEAVEVFFPAAATCSSVLLSVQLVEVILPCSLCGMCQGLDWAAVTSPFVWLLHWGNYLVKGTFVFLFWFLLSLHCNLLIYCFCYYYYISALAAFLQ